MKIMFCLGSMNKGGAERVIANLSNEFCKKYDISIVVTSPDEPMYELDKKIKFITLDKYDDKKCNVLFRNIRRISRLRKIIKNINSDIIVSLLPEPTYSIMVARMFLNKKVIISVRNDPKIEYNTWFKKILVKLLYTNANGFIFQTPDAQSWFSKKIQDKSIVIPNPINEKFICEPYLKERKKEIVTVGRLVEQKNHKLLIDAFYEFCKDYNDYILKIYGEGPLKQELQNQINNLELNKNVILMGETNDVKKEIYKSGIFVLSSDYEGMPNALMEAMALGIPCISTDCPCGGPRYLIEDSVDGFLINVNDKNSLVKSLKYIVENSDKMEKISINSNKKMKKYDLKVIAHIWEEYIKKIAEEEGK